MGTSRTLRLLPSTWEYIKTTPKFRFLLENGRRPHFGSCPRLGEGVTVSWEAPDSYPKHFAHLSQAQKFLKVKKRGYQVRDDHWQAIHDYCGAFVSGEEHGIP
jgi:hypothetical protein